MAREDIVKDMEKQGIFKAITGSIRDGFEMVPEQMKSGFNKVSGTIASNTSEVMGGALNKMVDDMKSMATGIKDMAMGGWDALFGSDEGTYEEESLTEAREQTSLLDKLLGFFVKKDRIEAMKYKAGKAKNSILDGLGTAMLLAGTLVGGAVGLIMLPLMGILKSFLIPFEVVGAALVKLLGIGKWLDAKVLKIGAWFKGTRVFSWLESLFSFFGKIGAFVKNIPVLGKVFGGFAKGFGTIMKGVPVIGWFITGVMGLIDFFTAFNETQGSLYEKIKAGITGMLTGFFDPIFELVGWLADKVLGWFGIDVEGGVASKLKDGFTWYIEKIFWFWESVFSFFSDFFTNIKEVYNSVKMQIAEWLGPIVTRIINIFGELKEGLSNGIDGIKEKFTPIIDTVVNFFSDFFTNIKEWITSFLPSMEDIKNHVTSMAKEYLPEWMVNKLVDDGQKMASGKFWWQDAKEDKKIDMPDASSEARKEEIENNKKLHDMTKKMIDEMEKTRKATEKKNETTVGDTNTSNVAVSQNSSRRSSSEFKEAPDEIENIGLIFLNKSTMGGW